MFARHPVDGARLRSLAPRVGVSHRENCESESRSPRNDVAGSKGTWIPSSFPGTCCLRCTAVEAWGVTAAISTRQRACIREPFANLSHTRRATRVFWRGYLGVCRPRVRCRNVRNGSERPREFGSAIANGAVTEGTDSHRREFDRTAMLDPICVQRVWECASPVRRRRRQQLVYRSVQDSIFEAWRFADGNPPRAAEASVIFGRDPTRRPADETAAFSGFIG